MAFALIKLQQIRFRARACNLLGVFHFQTAAVIAAQKMSTSSAPIATAEGAVAITWKRADGSDVPGYAFGNGGCRTTRKLHLDISVMSLLLAVGNPAIIVLQEWCGGKLPDALLCAEQFTDPTNAGGGSTRTCCNMQKNWRVTAFAHLSQISTEVRSTMAHSHIQLALTVHLGCAGTLGLEAEEAHHLMSNLDWPGAVEDIRGAARYLKSSEASAKVGVTGFCMGGALSLSAAVLVDEVDAAAPFYGIPQGVDLTGVKKPIQGHYGDKDTNAGFSDPAVRRHLRLIGTVSCRLMYCAPCRASTGLKKS
jgi:hypothetical protein